MQLIFDLSSQRIRKANWYRIYCSFAEGAKEAIPGYCVRVPTSTGGSVKRPGVPRSGEYQLTAQCDNLATVVIYIRPDNRSTVGGHNDFILRRIEGDKSPGYDLGECWQGDESEKDPRSVHFHVSVKSGETGVTSYSYAD